MLSLSFPCGTLVTVFSLVLIGGAQSTSAWRYHQTKEDSMGRPGKMYAATESINRVEFAAPYAGPQRATLTLRAEPKRAKFEGEVLLSVERGQFLCRRYCRVLWRRQTQRVLREHAIRRHN